MLGNSVFDAAYMIGHDHPGGIAGLAARINSGLAHSDKKISQNVLAHQLNPNDHANPLTVRNLYLVTAMTGDYRALHALCMDHGHMAIPLPPVDDESTNDAITDTIKEFSDFLQAVTKTLEDKKVTKVELRRVRNELAELVARGGKLEALLAAMEARGARR